MTEKDFLRKLGAHSDIQSESYMNLCRLALKLAQQQGAKFDTEPMELPSLQVSGVSPTYMGFCQSVCTVSLPGYPYGRALTGPEAKEIIRRCEAWKEIRALVDCIGDDDPETDRLRRMELIAILDGKESIK